MDRLLYATPTGRNPQLGYIASVRVVELTCKSFGERKPEDFMMVPMPVQMARTEIASLAMQRGYDYVLMHDDDLVLGPSGGDAWDTVGNPVDAWHRLMQEDPSIGAMGAVYMRERPRMPNVAVPHPRYPEELCHVVFGFPGEPVDVGAIGTGFMLIRVSALKALQDAEDSEGAPPLFSFPMRKTRWGLINATGEDYDFCRRLRGVGYRVVADPRYRTSHMKDCGPLVYDRAGWERTWTPGTPGFEHTAREMREQVPQAIRMEQVGGFTVLDHVPQMELHAKAWRARQQTKEAA